MEKIQEIKDSSFGNLFEKYRKVYFRGADKDFYGKEGKGPGAYYRDQGMSSNNLSPQKSPLLFSMPKVKFNNRILILYNFICIE